MGSVTRSETTDGVNTVTIAGSHTVQALGQLGLRPLGTDLPQAGGRVTIHMVGVVKEAGVVEAEAREAVAVREGVRAMEEKAGKVGTVGKVGTGRTDRIQRKLATIGGLVIVGESTVSSLISRRHRKSVETSHEPVLVGVARTAISNTPSREGRRRKDREQWQARQ